MDTAYGFCKCGCGQRTLVNAQTVRSRGWVKGEPRDYLRGHQAWGTSRSEAFWERVAKGGEDECWLWSSTRAPNGYGRFKFRKVVIAAHRVAWELTHGPISNGLLVCHRCDNPSCVNPAHLFLGTQKDNLADRDRKGRAVYRSGVDNPSAKLTPQTVAAIRDRYASGERQRALATEFGIHQGTVSLIVRRRIWSDGKPILTKG